MNYRLLFSLSALCLAFNINKAVHIDDTFYLETAQHILRDPLHPLSGLINWYSSADLIAITNIGPLPAFSYALVMAVFGISELVLHTVVSLMAVWAIWIFYRITKRFVPDHSDWLTAVFTLCPAFLPSQNLMVDVPQVTFWLAFLDWITTPPANRTSMTYGAAAAAIAAACLIKYTSLLLLPFYVGVILFRRAWLMLWWLGIPLVVLIGWSIWNYYDYGGIHIFSRKLPEITIKDYAFRYIEWISGLGAVAPFSLILLSTRFRVPLRRWIIAGSAAGGLLIFWNAHYPQAPYQIVIGWGLFFGNGCLLIGMTLSGAVSEGLTRWRLKDYERMESIVIMIVWVLSVSVFMVAFAPFIAVRHILLIVPPLLLLIGMQFQWSMPSRLRDAGVTLTVLIGIALAVSDYVWAGVYRTEGGRLYRELRQGSSATIWQVGHWGWQWYAKQNGMEQYDTTTSNLKPGDFVVVAEYVHKQNLTPEHNQQLHFISTKTIPSLPLTWFRTYNNEQIGGYYGFSYRWRSLPWRFSNAPLEVFTVYQVRDAASPETPHTYGN